MLQNTRFGMLDIPSEKRWECVEPMPGFEDLRKFALLQQAGQAPFIWLQSLEVPSLAFLIVDAACFGLRFVQAGGNGLSGFDAPPCVLVILPQRQDEPLRVHRLAPLLFDAGEGRFMQRVFEAEQVLGEGEWTGQPSRGDDLAWRARIVVFQPVAPLTSDSAAQAQASGRGSELTVP